jgi:HK97 family phage portal protein
MATILDRVAARLGYHKAKADVVQAEWLRATADAELYNTQDSTMPTAQLDLYKRLSWVQTAVGAIANVVATVPFGVSELDGEDTNAIENHPFELRLHRPNPNMSRFELLKATIGFYLLTGNAYWWLNRKDDKTEPTEIWIIPSNYVHPIPDGRLFISGYNYTTENGEDILIPRHEIMHFKTFNPRNQFVGSSPIEALATVATGDMAMQRWNTNYFDKNNAKAQGALAFSDMIDDSRWAKIKADITNRHGGTNREMMMLRNVGQGGVSWISMAMSQKDMEFLAGRTFNKEEIFNLYAPGLASMTAVNATEANSKAGKATFIELGVWPHLVAIAEKITNDLLPVYGDNLIGEFDDIRIADRGMMIAEQNAAAQIMTIDELRQEYYSLEPLADDRGIRLLGEPVKQEAAPEAAPEDPAAQLNQVFAYQVNSGIVTRAEARTSLGLPPFDKEPPAELKAKFEAIAAGARQGVIINN